MGKIKLKCISDYRDYEVIHKKTGEKISYDEFMLNYFDLPKLKDDIIFFFLGSFVTLMVIKLLG